MTGYDPGLVAKVAGTQRWSVLARTDLTTAEIGTWDPALLRDQRLLVPIDVQALSWPLTAPSRWYECSPRCGPARASQPSRRRSIPVPLASPVYTCTGRCPTR